MDVPASDYLSSQVLTKQNSFCRWLFPGLVNTKTIIYLNLSANDGEYISTSVNNYSGREAPSLKMQIVFFFLSSSSSSSSSVSNFEIAQYGL